MQIEGSWMGQKIVQPFQGRAASPNSLDRAPRVPCIQQVLKALDQEITGRIAFPERIALRKSIPSCTSTKCIHYFFLGMLNCYLMKYSKEFL